MSSDDPKWIEPFTGLSPAQFSRLVALVRRRGGGVQRGRPWRLPLEDIDANSRLVVAVGDPLPGR